MPSSAQQTSIFHILNPPSPDNLQVGAQVFAGMIHLYSGPKVKIFVGAEAKEYKIPKALLSFHSSYFRVVFGSNLKEAQDNVITLDDIDQKPFNILVQWLFTGYVNTLIDGKVLSSEVVTELIMFLIYADRFGCPGAEKVGTDAIRAILREEINLLEPSHVQLVSSLPDPHPARRLFGESCVCALLHPAFRTTWVGNGQVPVMSVHKRGVMISEMTSNPNFAMDVLKAVEHTMDNRPQGSPYWVDPLTSAPIPMFRWEEARVDGHPPLGEIVHLPGR